MSDAPPVLVSHAYSQKALDVLELVRQGRPFDGRSVAGRRAHLRWLLDKGLVQPGMGLNVWELTEHGKSVLAMGYCGG